MPGTLPLLLSLQSWYVKYIESATGVQLLISNYRI